MYVFGHYNISQQLKIVLQTSFTNVFDDLALCLCATEIFALLKTAKSNKSDGAKVIIMS